MCRSSGSWSSSFCRPMDQAGITGWALALSAGLNSGVGGSEASPDDDDLEEVGTNA